MVSQRDIAKLLGVSQGLVSHVLNGRYEGRIPEETRQKVLEAARQLGYRPHAAARTLVTGRTRNLALVIHDHHYAAHPFFSPEFLSNVLHAAAQAGHSVTIASTRLDLSSVGLHYWTKVEESAVDGLIIFDHVFPPEGLRRLAQRKVPFVTIDYQAPDLGTQVVALDHLNAFRRVTRLFREAGYARAGIVLPWPGGHWASPFLEACEEAGFSPRKGTALMAAPTGRDQKAAFTELLRHEWKVGREPIGIVTQTAGVPVLYQVLAQLSARVPEEVGVVCFDDMPAFPHFAPPVTSLVIPWAKVAQTAVRHLMRLIEDGDGEVPKPIKLDLVLRGSVRTPNLANNEGGER